MTPTEFVAKWQSVRLSERSACQQHFCDLCDLLDHPKPAEADPEGTHFTFERGVRTVEGSQGWADVWKRGHFGWEYKRRHKDLKAAYDQLLLYREDLENPPLLVVSDMDRFEVHTNFTGTAKQVHAFNLAGLAQPRNLDVLRKVFFDPEALRPEVTTVHITEEAADRFGELADGMRLRGVEAHPAAHFLMKLMFCMFGEDIGLLPEGLFSHILEGSRRDPAQLARRLEGLFKAMASGGDFGADPILRFNGGLFADAGVVKLTPEEIATLINIDGYDWASVEPSIFGTLFERTLDPGKRSQIGAHYTSKADILTLLEPVVMAPLRREWEAVKTKCEKELWPRVSEPGRVGPVSSRGSRSRAVSPRFRSRAVSPRFRSRAVSARSKDSKERRAFDRALLDFAERLAHVTVLDPACGSGNFLYVAINLLLDLEKEAISYAASHGLSMIPHVRPTQLSGIEINPFAQELAQVVIWIGYLQWMHHNGFRAPTDPVLEPIESIRCMDAILDLSDPKNPREPEWPEAEFIVGNPPFLGGKRVLSQLGESYTKSLRRVWDDRLPRFSDLCCYWFEKARDQIASEKTRRAALLATQAIRGGANRLVLNRIKETGDIFFAISDRNWILDGANVHVSIVGFDDRRDDSRTLDGNAVPKINANLTAGANVGTARTILTNANKSFIGVQKSGPFDIHFEKAQELLRRPSVGGRPNSDVIRPYWTAVDLVRRPLNVWVIDFRALALEVASHYEAPFEYVKTHIPPERAPKHFQGYPFWHLWRPRPEMYAALQGMRRFIITPLVSKHRVFIWADACIDPSNLLIAIAADRDLDFGMLQSRVHEVWSLAQGTQLREKESGNRYTPTTCYETFPFPEPTAEQEAAIAAAAKELDELRTRWLNPPEWTKTEVLEFPGSVDGPWARYIDPATVRPIVGRLSKSSHVPRPGRPHPNPLPKGEGTSGAGALPEGEGTGIGTVRWPRIVPKDPDCAESLKKRTLTNLYNERPAWLDLAHKRLDHAVFAAYGWDAGMADEELLQKLLGLNLARSRP
jgi:hypothetical protein